MKYFIFPAIAILGISIAGSQEKADTTDTLQTGVVLPEVETFGNASNRSNASTLDMGMLKMDKKQLLSIPSMTGEPDIIKALAIQPGVSEGVEGFSGLYVRGGNNDQNLILLNGTPLYQISHLGGLFSSFNTEIVDGVTFYKSAFPAQYGGRLSSVVDISTREPEFNEYHGAASLGLTAGMLHLTGPLFDKKTAFDISLRRSWLDVITSPALAVYNKLQPEGSSKVIARYAFTDVNARLDHKFSSGNRLRFSFYWGNDLFKYGNKEDESNDGSYSRHVNKLRWGNAMASLAWDYRYNQYLTSEISASFTRYKSQNQRENRTEYTDDGAKSLDMSNRNDKNTVDDISLFARWLYSRSNYDFRFGVYYQHHNFLPSDVNFESEKDGEIERFRYANYRIRSHEQGAYADFTWQPLRWLGLDAGLRFSSIRIYDRWESTIEPRFLMNFSILPSLSFKASYTRMGQYVQQVSDSYVNLPTDSWMPMGKNADPLVSDQVAGGFYFDWANGYSFSLEGYYKWLDGVAEVSEDYAYSFDKMQNILYGKGRVYGAELSMTKNFGRLTGSASYGLMWNDRKIDGVNGGEWYHAKFDTRHKINLTATYRLNKKIELNASWVFATGNRMTVPVGMYQGSQDTGFPDQVMPRPDDGYGNENLGLKYYTGRNNVRIPNYHRLDIGASFTKQLKKGRKGVWRVGLYNAYCHMNPMVVQQSHEFSSLANGGYISNGGSKRPWNVKYQTFSMFPIIPNVSYTFYF